MIRIPPIGPKSSLIALVGEAGGDVEERKREPFVGPAGKQLDTLIAAAGLTRGELWITNLLKAHPTGNDISPWFGQVHKAKWQELEALGCLTKAIPKSWDTDECSYYALTLEGMRCRGELIDELNSLPNLRVIVTLGNTSTFALTGRAGIETIRGAPIQVAELPNKIIIPTLHPANIVRGDYLDRWYISVDLRRAKEAAKIGFQLPRRDLLIADRLETALPALRGLRSEPIIAFDIETSYRVEQILSIAFSPHPKWAVAIPLVGWTMGEEEVIWDEIRALMATPGKMIGHNVMFDAFILEWKRQVKFARQLECTMSLHRIAYPELLSGLASLTGTYTWEPFYKADGKESRRVSDVKGLLIYNAKDAATTRELWDVFDRSPKFLGDPLHLKTYRFTMDLHRPLMAMMRRGLRADPAVLEKARVEAIDRLFELQGELDRIAAPAFAEAQAPFLTALVDAQKEVERLSEQRQKIGKRGQPLKSKEYVFPIAARRAASKRVTELNHQVAEWAPEIDPDTGRSILLNTSSNPKMVWYFYTRTGMKPYLSTRKMPTVDEDALARLATPIAGRPGFPEATLILKIRAKRKEYETFFQGKEEDDEGPRLSLLDDDGRFRCQYVVKGTKTGRLASRKTFWKTGANHQNIPEEFRSFVIPDEGCFFAAIDKSGAEWVVTAYASGDEAMIRVVEGGISPHLHTAHAMMGGISYEALKAEHAKLGTITNAEEVRRVREELIAGGWEEFGRKWDLPFPPNGSIRQLIGKKSNHALNYQEGPNKFALLNNIPIPLARQMIDLYTKKAYPRLSVWWAEIEAQIRKNRTRVNCFGRKYKFLGPLNAKTFREATAFIPQSTIVDGVNQGLIWIDRHLPRLTPMVQKHDELLFQYRFEDLPHFWDDISAAAEAMTPEMEYRGRKFKVANTLSMGMSWGDLGEVKWDRVKIEKRIEGMRQ